MSLQPRKQLQHYPQLWTEIAQNTMLHKAVRTCVCDFTASQLAVMIGAHPYKSRASIWRILCNGGEEPEPAEFQRRQMDRGIQMEPVIAEALEQNGFAGLNMVGTFVMKAQEGV